MDELTEALHWYAEQPCAECGQPLGREWQERYNEATDRLEKVHPRCP